MSAYVPKTEAEREQIVALCKQALTKRLHSTYADTMSERGISDDDIAEGVVPKVPRVKRVAALYGMFEATFRDVAGYGTAMFITHDSATGATGPQSFEDIVAEAPKALRTRIAAQLLDLLANPDEPAPPAAAQGGAWPALGWDDFLEVREWIHAVMERRKPSHVTPEEMATLNAKLSTLLGAVPVGRALRELDYSEAVAFCIDMKRLVEGTGLPEGFTAAVNNALRGLAPTVTP